MEDFRTGYICLSDIPKEKIRKGDNGKLYLNICESRRREVGRYGDTHTIYVSQSEEERAAKADKAYIGAMKEFVPKVVTPESIENMPPIGDDEPLPFL